MGKASIKKPNKKLQQVATFNQTQEDSGYTAEFFNDEQLTDLRCEKQRTCILELLKKQMIIVKKSYKQVKVQLQERFGLETIKMHKEWLINTLNARKSESKSNTPSTAQLQNQKKGTPKSGQIAITKPSNRPSMNDQKSSISKQESIHSQKTHRRGGPGDLIRHHLPELNQIDELISKRFEELTTNSMKDMYDRLLIKVPDILETDVLASLNDKVAEVCNKVQEVEQRFREMDIPTIQELINQVREEIEQTFQILVADIKKVAPTIGIATQESLASHVRRVHEQIQALTKSIESADKNIRELSEKYSSQLEILNQSQSKHDHQHQMVEKNMKNVIDQVNKIIVDHKQGVADSLYSIKENIKSVVNRVSKVEKLDIQNQGQQIQQQELQSLHQDQSQNTQQHLKIEDKNKNDNHYIEQTISKYNSGNQSIQIFKIDKTPDIFKVKQAVKEKQYNKQIIFYFKILNHYQKTVKYKVYFKQILFKFIFILQPNNIQIQKIEVWSLTLSEFQILIIFISLSYSQQQTQKVIVHLRKYFLFLSFSLQRFLQTNNLFLSNFEEICYF
ncbi:hypothetical protein OXYTRIMIC_223 [Oxytricha trifallax]|uniref:Uncharacterized protein n=1 Tax=Oxytricha trifallax TaxID=1172189 RepID=A0A073I0F1_9SPIT|nr:hypothetical protein OXYTRIMIC_223 [Oxytricha trifallax]